MCEPAPRGLTRRELLGRTGSIAAAAVILPRSPLLFAASPASASSGLPVSMAMHIHASFSEQEGSMAGQLQQAAQNKVDVIWWTDHDYRMSAMRFRKVVHFNSLDSELGEDGKAWRWVRSTGGSPLPDDTSGVVASPVSPLDPDNSGSLRIAARSSGSASAYRQFYADSYAAGYDYRSNLTGQSLSIEVFPQSIGQDSYLELRIDSSRHPAKSGRPAGIYSISYRFGGAGAPSSRVAKGITGIVTVPVTRGAWNSVTIHPGRDIAALWNDVDSRDFGLYGLTLAAVSQRGALAAGAFDYLRFSRNVAGQVPLQVQRSLVAAYAPAFPTVAQRQGLEVSWTGQHVNWFGGAVALPDYTGVPRDLSHVQQMVDFIHRGGGVASLNHPFGASDGPVLPIDQQNANVLKVGQQTLQYGAFGCDLIEVGYPERARMDMRHHLDLWDICSRNALFLTGNGTSDDHSGTAWISKANNWLTYAWAASDSEAALQQAMLSGRLYTASLSAFRGALDLVADGLCPMGSVTVSQVASRALKLVASGLPSGSSVHLRQGTVDYAGAVAAGTKVVASYPAAAFVSGHLDQQVDTRASSFVRTEVLDAAGHLIAISNPIWLLRAAPPGGVPAARQC